MRADTERDQAYTYEIKFGLQLQAASDGTAMLQAPATPLAAATSWSGVWTRNPGTDMARAAAAAQHHLCNHA